MDDIVEELRHWASVAFDSDSEVLDKAAAEIERLRLEHGRCLAELGRWPSTKGELTAEIKRLRANAAPAARQILSQQAEIERLRKENALLLTAKHVEIVTLPIPEGFVIQELQKANAALHADIARLRSGTRCPHCDALRLDLGDARREIDRLRADLLTARGEVEDLSGEVARLRGLLRDLLPEIDFADGELDPTDDIVVLRLRERVREALGDVPVRD